MKLIKIIKIYLFIPCLIFLIPFLKTILLCGGDGIEFELFSRTESDGFVSNKYVGFGFAIREINFNKQV